MSQSRKVYFIQIQGKFHNEPHPHVDLSNTGNDRLVVPCFSVGGDELESVVTDEKNNGYLLDQIYVETDNQRCIAWFEGNRGTKSWWLVHRANKIDCQLLRKPAGELDADSVRLIAKAMLSRHSKTGKWLSPKTKAMLEALAK